MPGKDQNTLSDFLDDEDHAVGRAILELLTANNITHRAVFIACYVGEKLHADRFLAYKTAVAETIKKANLNPICNRLQEISADSLQQQQGITSSTSGPKQKSYAGTVAAGYQRRGKGRGGFYRGSTKGARGGTRNSKDRPKRVYHPRNAESIQKTKKSNVEQVSEKIKTFEFRRPLDLSIEEGENHHNNSMDIEDWDQTENKGAWGTNT